MLIAKIFGVTGTAGLTLALCRRARTVFWAGVGAICMIAMKRAEARSRNQKENSGLDMDGRLKPLAENRQC